MTDDSTPSPADLAVPDLNRRSRARVIAVANQKGGVGKTTTTINLGAALAELGAEVLIVDLDPQGNATTGIGVDHRSLQHSIYHVLMHDVPLVDVVVATETPKLSIAPSTLDLAGAEIEMVSAFSRETRLQRAIEPVLTRFDYVLIDCPPSLGLLTVNGLTAAKEVLVPVQCEYYALEGLTALLDTIEKIRTTLNFDLRIEGLLRTMYDPRNNLANDVSTQLIEHFGEQVFNTIIPRNVRLAEAPSHGLPAIMYDKTSPGARAYLALAGEMLRRDAREREQAPAPATVTEHGDTA